MRLPVLFTALLLGLLVACADSEDVAPSTKSPTATQPSVITTPSPSITSSPAATEGTAKYTDPTYGYSFEYPHSWQLSPVGQGYIELTSYDSATSSGSDAPLGKDKIKIAFLVHQGIAEPLSQWLATTPQPGQPPAAEIVSESSVTIGGIEGVRRETRHDESGSVIYYLPLGKDQLIVISAIPFDSEILTEFETLVRTFREKV